jgi:hypothetical protein
MNHPQVVSPAEWQLARDELLDLTPLGRQEDWENAPDGWPQTTPYVWWRLHDEYEHQPQESR